MKSKVLTLVHEDTAAVVVGPAPRVIAFLVPTQPLPQHTLAAPYAQKPSGFPSSTLPNSTQFFTPPSPLGQSGSRLPAWWIFLVALCPVEVAALNWASSDGLV